MFEIDIKEESRKGIMLHKRLGIQYWKLSLVCCRDGCENLVDMGECLCFEEEDEMVACRDGHGMTCSTECWLVVASAEAIVKMLADIKIHNEKLETRGDSHLIIDGGLVSVIDDYLEYIADSWDGCSFWEEWDIQECPV